VVGFPAVEYTGAVTVRDPVTGTVLGTDTLYASRRIIAWSYNIYNTKSSTSEGKPIPANDIIDGGC
jgi:hypothetical protein